MDVPVTQHLNVLPRLFRRSRHPTPFIQPLQRSFQLDAARCLQQNHIAVPEILRQPITCFFGLGYELRENTSGCGSFHYKARGAANSEKNVDLALSNMIPTLAMKIG